MPIFFFWPSYDSLYLSTELGQRSKGFVKQNEFWVTQELAQFQSYVFLPQQTIPKSFAHVWDWFF